ncbi:MAG: HlyD family secretion protein, partial [Dysgonamonadaceae bacterium]|nr:HlyD family secretion protein [Dysgonamonadaceae bacterium]
MKQNRKRSEEISDIIDRMPTTFGRRVAMAVVVFAVLLLFFGWIIKYPDTVTGQIKINSSQSPVKLIANTSGKLRLSGHPAGGQVREGEYIAFIQNPADTEDMRRISELLFRFNPNNDSFRCYRDSFPKKVSLGELNLKYYAFLSSLTILCNYRENNIYDRQEKSLKEDIAGQKLLREQTLETLETVRGKMEIAAKWLEKDALLNQKAIIHEQQLDQVKNEYLSVKQGYQNLQRELSSIAIQVTGLENKLKQLKIEQWEEENRMHLDLLSSYHDLVDNIKLWEQKYVFKAPFDGRIEFLKFWTNDQFVQAGEEVFSLIPRNTNAIGQVFLPAGGAGKVKPGCKVNIKLDNYPYMEYGSIEGEVASISLVTRQEQLQQGSIDTYLILVDLPLGLTTNYGELLDFRYELGGTADIIVKDRRLIERLFDNLRYR